MYVILKSLKNSLVDQMYLKSIIESKKCYFGYAAL